MTDYFIYCCPSSGACNEILKYIDEIADQRLARRDGKNAFYISDPAIAAKVFAILRRYADDDDV